MSVAGRGGRSWPEWQAAWDRQQEHYLPDREERFATMLALLGAGGARELRILDLAGGCGSITARLLEAMPTVRVTLVDLDPVLLRIAAGVFHAEPRVAIAERDLRDPAWSGSLPAGSFDAVLTATALHWLSGEQLSRVYQSCFHLLRPGGVLANADHIPARADGKLAELLPINGPPTSPEGVDPWEGWWTEVGEDPVLAPLLAERARRFGSQFHPAEFTPPEAWHLLALTEGGFSDAAVIWRRGGDAIVAGVA